MGLPMLHTLLVIVRLVYLAPLFYERLRGIITVFLFAIILCYGRTLQDDSDIDLKDSSIPNVCTDESLVQLTVYTLTWALGGVSFEISYC